MGEIDGIRISVLLSATPTSPLYIELQAANIEYLRQVVAYQISAGSIARAPHQSASASAVGDGLTALRRGKYRFRCRKRRSDGSRANLYIKNADGAAAKMIASEFDPDARKRRRKNAHAQAKDDDDEEEEEEEEDTLDSAPVASSFLVKQEPSVATIVKKEVEDLRKKFANTSSTGTIVIESSGSESGID